MCGRILYADTRQKEQRRKHLVSRQKGDGKDASLPLAPHSLPSYPHSHPRARLPLVCLHRIMERKNSLMEF